MSMQEQKANYYIEKFWNDYQKLKDGDIEYCYPFYECLVKHYQKRNSNNKNFRLLLKYVFHERFIQGVDWYRGTLTEQIVGDNYICCSEGILLRSDSPCVENNFFEYGPDIPYLNLDYGTLKFSRQAFDFITKYNKSFLEKHTKSNPSEENNEQDKYELISLDSCKSGGIARKILRFANTNVYAEAYKKRIKTICGYLAKSVTVGEYLILDNYSEKYLDPVFNGGNKNKESSGLGDSNPKDELNADGFLGKMLNDIGAAASKLRSMCRTMGMILKNHQSTKKRPIRVVGFKNAIPFSFGEIANPNVSCLWRRAIEAISLIAYIDFAYFSTFQNIETLCTSREILKQLRNAYRGDSMVENEIVTPNIVKASKLLHDCIVFHDKSESDSELERELLLQDYNTDRDIRNSVLFHKFPERPSQFDVVSERLYFSQRGYEDLKRYHNIGSSYCSMKKKGRKIYEISKKRLSAEIDKDDFKTIESELNNDNVWTASLLVKTIRRLTFWAEDKCNRGDVSSVCDAAFHLLRRLEQQCLEYEKGNRVPGKIETPFNKSFYEVSCTDLESNLVTEYTVDKPLTLNDLTGTVKDFDKKSVMFMQSISTTPVALNFLISFINKYDRKINDVSIRISHEIQRQYSVQFSGLTKIKEDVKKELKDTQSHSLQLLGILGAFIALISVGANALSDVPVDRFFVFVVVVTGCVIALLLCISLVFEKNNRKKLFGYCLLLVIAIIATLCIVSK